MKITLITIFIIIVLGIGLSFLLKDKANEFQHDADLIRMEHLEYWTGLIEDYHKKTGKYPFVEKLENKEKIGLVRIASKKQQEYFNPKSSKYFSKIDNNSDGFFQEFKVGNFVKELENKLGKKIDEKYDIQKIPNYGAIGYNYFISEKGYFFWVMCNTCGVSPVTTLLMDGTTPTLNIASENLVKEIPNSFKREDLIKNSIYQNFRNKPFYKEDYIRNLESENFNNSKK